MKARVPGSLLSLLGEIEERNTWTFLCFSARYGPTEPLQAGKEVELKLEIRLPSVRVLITPNASYSVTMWRHAGSLSGCGGCKLAGFCKL